jgi:hypothetical protein
MHAKIKSELLCDGCGQPAQAEHIAERFRRLELATRFRPIHISVLFLMGAPPSALADYFYNRESRSKRSADAQAFFDGLMECVGAKESSDDGTALAGFQHLGHFLASCTECPLETATEFAHPHSSDALAERYGPTVVKRVRLSYKPKRIVLLGEDTRGIIPFLEGAGLGSYLLLNRRKPFKTSTPQDFFALAQFFKESANLRA